MLTLVVYLGDFIIYMRLKPAISNGKELFRVLDEHDSPQWYDIVHFEHKLSWVCFGLPQKALVQWS